MNRVLIEIIAQFALFLELADESEIPLETAVKQQEEMAFRLQKLTQQDRSDFILLLKVVAADEEFNHYQEILNRLPEDVGLV